MEPEQLLIEITNRLDAGFGKVHEKVDELRCDFTTHKEHCYSRFTVLETDFHVRTATNGIKKEHEQEERDWWKWVIRSVVVLAIPSIPWAIYKLTAIIEAMKKIGIVE